MRIAIVADDLYPGFGGQAAATEGHIAALVQRGHRVRVLAGMGAGATGEAEVPAGVEVTRLRRWQPGKKQTQFAWPDRRALEALLSWADVVQLNTPTPLTYLAVRLAGAKGVPSVIGFHTQEESLTSHVGPLRPVVSVLLRQWYRFLYHQPECLVAPTPFAARLARRYTPRPVHVVSNGIRLPQEVGEAERQRWRERYLPGGKRHLLAYVGRLAQEKAPQRLLELMSALKALRGDVQLVIAGSGPLRGELERRAQALGLAQDVQFAGFLSEETKSELLWAADVFLMPSPTELQSIATLEALARACAVVATEEASSAVSEMVRDAEAGFSYRPAHAAAAARQLSQALEDAPRLALWRERARRFALGHDVAESGRQLERIYLALLGERQLRPGLSAMGAES